MKISSGDLFLTYITFTTALKIATNVCMYVHMYVYEIYKTQVTLQSTNKSLPFLKLCPEGLRRGNRGHHFGANSVQLRDHQSPGGVSPRVGGHLPCQRHRRYLRPR